MDWVLINLGLTVLISAGEWLSSQDLEPPKPGITALKIHGISIHPWVSNGVLDASDMENRQSKRGFAMARNSGFTSIYPALKNSMVDLSSFRFFFVNVYQRLIIIHI